VFGYALALIVRWSFADRSRLCWPRLRSSPWPTDRINHPRTVTWARAWPNGPDSGLG